MNKLVERIHKYKTPTRRRRELMLTVWQETDSLDAVYKAFREQLHHNVFIDDMKWLIGKIEKPNHKWLLAKSLSQRLYFITDGEFIKIGISDDPRFRLKGMQTGSPRTLYLEYCGNTADAYVQEQYLHNKFKHLRVRGEWFKYTDEIKDQIELSRNNEEYFESRLLDVNFT